MRSVAAGLQAFVLHHYDWSESSLILDVFTRERGRLAIAAKGAKRPHSQWRSVLLPFHPLAITLGRQPVDENAEILNLRQAEWVGGGCMLKGQSLFAGFYLNELLMKMLARQDPHPQLFDTYAQVLGMLQVEDAVFQGALRAFELTLLRESGLLPDLARVTLTQQALDPPALYELAPESGVAPATRARDGHGEGEARCVTGAELLRLAAALDEGSPQTLARVCSQTQAGLRPLLKDLLHYHLGSTELRSRRVLQGMRRLLGTAAAPQAA